MYKRPILISHNTNDLNTMQSKQQLLAIAELDLEPIIVKLMDQEEGEGWALDFALRVSEEYKKFLLLNLLFPDASIIPSKYVDEFWHYHILDTSKYQDDCEQYLGFFLHHFPYFGMRGPEDEINLQNAWKETLSIYESQFGQIPVDIWASSQRCPNCGRRCHKKTLKEERPRLSTII